MTRHNVTETSSAEALGENNFSLIHTTACGQRRWKRVLDLTLILLALPVILPLAMIIGILIWIVSDGPILFCQERVGYRGNRFICFKFRTMFLNNDIAAHQKHLARLMASNHPLQKMDAAGDPRIIPLGRWWRSSGLDELPQLLNVILGDMSLVGPRPCLPYEFEKYTPAQRERFNALPGLTGLWQVSGKNKTTFAKMIDLDIQYSRTQTLKGDLAIMLATFPVLFGQLWEMLNRRQPLLRQAQLRSILSGTIHPSRTLRAGVGNSHTARRFLTPNCRPRNSSQELAPM